MAADPTEPLEGEDADEEPDDAQSDWACVIPDGDEAAEPVCGRLIRKPFRTR